MANSSEIAAQVAQESERRERLAVPVFAGGMLYLLSAIIVAATLSGAPSVGLLQGLSPALRGEANPAVSPRAGEVKYISHHALALVAGSVLKAIAIGALTLALLLLLDATRFRRPQTWPAARPLVLYGGAALALVSLVHQVAAVVQAHDFAVGHDFTNHAVDEALTKGAVNIAGQYLALLAALALMAGMIATAAGAMRAGLLTRWMGVLGIFSGILIFLPLGGATFEIVPAFWMVALGILYLGRWPNGDPPAWAAGEARPWPSQAELRAERAGNAPAGKAAGKPALLPAGADVGPAPAAASAPRSSRKRRRKGR
jgi:hypothetical protein